jgi:hypothetical protein
MIGLVCNARTRDSSRRARRQHSSINARPTPFPRDARSTTSIRTIAQSRSKNGAFGWSGGMYVTAPIRFPFASATMSSPNAASNGNCGRSTPTSLPNPYTTLEILQNSRAPQLIIHLRTNRQARCRCGSAQSRPLRDAQRDGAPEEKARTTRVGAGPASSRLIQGPASTSWRRALPHSRHRAPTKIRKPGGYSFGALPFQKSASLETPVQCGTVHSIMR